MKLLGPILLLIVFVACRDVKPPTSSILEDKVIRFFEDSISCFSGEKGVLTWSNNTFQRNDTTIYGCMIPCESDSFPYPYPMSFKIIAHDDSILDIVQHSILFGWKSIYPKSINPLKFDWWSTPESHKMIDSIHFDRKEFMNPSEQEKWSELYTGNVTIYTNEAHFLFDSVTWFPEKNCFIHAGNGRAITFENNDTSYMISGHGWEIDADVDSYKVGHGEFIYSDL